MAKSTWSNKKTLVLVGGISAMLLSLFSCQHPTDRNGIPHIIQHRYWNYYERGIAYSIVNEWAKAAEDFRVALGESEGALYPEYHELRRSKTYGVHFINNYFPHRELGISYYFLDALEKAEKELLLSLEMLPSSRAKYYMNKVRSAKLSKLNQSGPNPIRIDLDFPVHPAAVNRPWIILKGVVSSPYKIAEITVKRKRELIELASETVDLNSRIPLDPGNNSIEIVAHDLAGFSRTWVEEIISDLEGPSISLTHFGSSGNDRLKIEIKDTSNLMHVEVQGKEQDLKINSNVHLLEIPIEPTRKIKIEAIDGAGNKTIFEGNTGALQKASRETQKLYPDQRLVMHKNLNNQSLSDVHHAFLPSRKAPPDTLAPVIRLYPDIPDQLTVTSTYYILDFSVEDPGFIDTISLGINRKKFIKEGPKTSAIHTRFTQTVELKPEENHIVISAADKAGNVKNKKVRIYRKVPFDKFQKYRMTLAADVDKVPETFTNPKIFDFVYKKRIDDISTLNLSGVLNKLILNQEVRRFNLLERDKTTIKKLMLEHKIIHSSMRDFRYALDTNKVRDAEWYLRGSLSLRGGEKEQNWILTGELMDVQEGTVIAHSDTYFEGDSLEDIEYGLRIFVSKIIQQLPLHAATIEKGEKKDRVIVSLGIQDHIKRNFRFMFLDHKDTNLRFSDPLMSSKGQWIQGVVTDVSQNKCLVEIFPKGAGQSINDKDTAFLR